MTTSIWWLRRDLRLTDNPALQAALDSSDIVLPVFIIDPNLTHGRWHSPKRLSFLWEGLRSLDQELQLRGSRLIIRQGPPDRVLQTLLNESQAQRIYAEADFSPYARQRDQHINQTLPLTLVGGSSLLHPEMVVKTDGSPYVVFTPFSKTWKSLPLPGTDSLLPAPQHIRTPKGIHTEKVPANLVDISKQPFPAREIRALERLERFYQGAEAPIWKYAAQRNRPDLEGTSQLSPYLRFGMLSARQAIAAAKYAIENAPSPAAQISAETWLSELIWREFYINILYHFPQVLDQNFRHAYDDLAWRTDSSDFEAWCQGQTGYPLIDAAMRQLQHQGWMHNRARMLTASFLTKDLLIDWRWGQDWFMLHLIDGDPAANNGGWQWSAGTGSDAAPYFRIFNPILQSQKFDPHGSYIRRWLPELKQVPDKYIHAPWEMPVSLQLKSNCRIGQDYPAPIVDHATARERTLDAFTQARSKT